MGGLRKPEKPSRRKMRQGFEAQHWFFANEEIYSIKHIRKMLDKMEADGITHLSLDVWSGSCNAEISWTEHRKETDEERDFRYDCEMEEYEVAIRDYEQRIKAERDALIKRAKDLGLKPEDIA